MKKTDRVILMVLKLCVAALAVFLIAVVLLLNWPPPAKAMQAIRAFESDPDLHPKFVARMSKWRQDKVWHQREFYIFRQKTFPGASSMPNGTLTW